MRKTSLMKHLVPLGLTLLAGIAQAGTIEVSFDIKPTSCPNPFNSGYQKLLEGGTFPTAILGDDEFDTSRINPNDGLVIVVPDGGGKLGETLIPPISVGYEDVATPVADNSNCNCTTDGPDGFIDLTAHFDHDAIDTALGQVNPGDEIVICIRGFLDDGTPFEGCDCIWIVGPVSVDSSTWGRTKAGYR